ncbi:MAG: hypothetical protein K6G06_00205, partial [Butyrivibrio sp.]|nr:hypothetical protein [Butyrivibrio sp.]
GTKYQVYVYPVYKRTGTYKRGEIYTGSTSAYGDIRTTPGVVTGVNQTRWYRWAKTCHVAWDDQTGVDGYEVTFSKHDGSVIERKTVDYNSYSHSIQNTIIYKVSVRAYSNINGRVYYSPSGSPDCFCMVQPSVKEDKAEVGIKWNGNRMKISWKKLNGATGYNVYMSTSKDSGYKKVKSVNKSKSSVTISKLGKKKLSKGKKYYIYVEAYKKVNGNTFTTGRNYITTVKGKKVSFEYASGYSER